MKRRTFIESLALGCLASGCGQVETGGEDFPVPRRNILLIISDQFRRPVWFGSEHLPNYEKFVGNSLDCCNSFISSVSCVPSRACLFSGLLPHENGVVSNYSYFNPGLSLGHVIKSLGYSTHYFGKWHLTDGSGIPKDENGFSFHVPDCHNGRGDGYTYDDQVVKSFAQWLQTDDAKEPWFTVVSLLNPHNICHNANLINDYNFASVVGLPGNYDEHSSSSSDDVFRRRAVAKGVNFEKHINAYYWFCRNTDYNLGRVLDLVCDQDMLIAFTSDHGEMGGSHGMVGKPPVLYDECVRVPLVVSGAGVTGVSDAFIGNTDVLATLLGFEGYSGALRGEDLSKVLFSPQGVNREVRFEAVSDRRVDSFVTTIGSISRRGRVVYHTCNGIEEKQVF